MGGLFRKVAAATHLNCNHRAPFNLPENHEINFYSCQIIFFCMPHLNTTIDVNCDMGEGMPYDAQLMPLISSTNIACGYHAGNEDTMKLTIALALKHGVAIGAHPGFDDKENFGRRNLQHAPAAIYDLTVSQIVLLEKIADGYHTRLHHVKPHGALYNLAAINRNVAHAVASAVFDTNASLILYGLSGSYLVSEAKKLGLKTASEVFADRTYQDNGQLTPRSLTGALIQNAEDCKKQVMQMMREQSVTSIHGKSVPIVAETVCVHGDGKHALLFAEKIVEALKLEHVAICAP